MFEYADDGELYLEKVIGFLRVRSESCFCLLPALPECAIAQIVFAEWAHLKVTHVFSIILFSRTYYTLETDNSATVCCALVGCLSMHLFLQDEKSPESKAASICCCQQTD